jgi:uncharacterized repeat protein (TIGR03803 family)
MNSLIVISLILTPGTTLRLQGKSGGGGFQMSMARHTFSVGALFALLLIAALPAQSQTETTLYTFTGGSDGGKPASTLIFDKVGNLYGTTQTGGAGFGTVFELSPDGHGGWTESVLYAFTGGTDGSEPGYAPLIFDAAGNLYGTTYMGGAKRQGVVFELTPAEGSWKETVLYSFVGSKKDGGNPEGAIVMDGAGNIYGTTVHGAGTRGAVYELSPAGGGAWTERVLYGVEASDGGLAMDGVGDLFGTSRDKKIFELSPNGKGGFNAIVVYTFLDGEIPQGTLAFDGRGSLYGTAYPGGEFGGGTVYRLTPGKNGWNEETLESLQRHSPDPFHPLSGVVVDGSGNVFGTTVSGGTARDGTLFELVPTGRSYTLNILWNFNGDGADPHGGLVRDGAGNLYGTAYFGGHENAGTVVEVTP